MVEIRLYALIHEAATTVAIYNSNETVDTYGGRPRAFLPCSGLSSIGQFSRFLEEVDVVSNCCCCSCFFGGGAVDGRDASDFGPISRATS